MSALLDERTPSACLDMSAKGQTAPAQNNNHEGTNGGPPAQPTAAALSLLLDALDCDPTEAGVFVAKLCLKLPLFDIERLQRVHIGKLQEHDASRWRRSTHADCLVKAAGDVFTAAFLDVGLRLGQKVLGVTILVFDIDFHERISRWLGLRMQDADRAAAQNKADKYSRRNFIIRLHRHFLLVACADARAHAARSKSAALRKKRSFEQVLGDIKIEQVSKLIPSASDCNVRVGSFVSFWVVRCVAKVP